MAFPSPFTPRFILPLMIFVGVLAVGTRALDAFSTIESGALFSSALAETPAQAAKPAADTKPEESKPAKSETTANLPPAPLAPQEQDGSPESDLYRQLAGRRDQLDKRAQELDSREALIRVAETRVDQKLKEMETLRAQIQSLLGQADAAQQAQIENLVKIYEIMKPKEAAKIFESLDMPILLGVVQKMKPARTAAVLAEMNPQKAKDITTALTKQDQLPQLKQDSKGATP